MLISELSWSEDSAIKVKSQTRLFRKTLTKQGDYSKKNSLTTLENCYVEPALAFSMRKSRKEKSVSRDFFSIYDVFEVKSVNFLNFYKGKYFFSYTQQM